MLSFLNGAVLWQLNKILSHVVLLPDVGLLVSRLAFFCGAVCSFRFFAFFMVDDCLLGEDFLYFNNFSYLLCMSSRQCLWLPAW